MKNSDLAVEKVAEEVGTVDLESGYGARREDESTLAFGLLRVFPDKAVKLSIRQLLFVAFLYENAFS